MKYAIDCEFIDTPTCSALISLAIVREDGEERYFEFDYPEDELTDWLRKHVVPKLTGRRTSFDAARDEILAFTSFGIDYTPPQFWGFYVSYDWYWLCRIIGGLMQRPRCWPARPRELADKIIHLNIDESDAHNALTDARAVMHFAKNTDKYPFP